MKAPVVVDELEIMGAARVLNTGEDAAPLDHRSGQACHGHVDSVAADYKNAIERCENLFRRLPPLNSAVRFKRVWSIQDAVAQDGELRKQSEILGDIGRDRIQVRKLQLDLSEKFAKDMVSQLGGIEAQLAAGSSLSTVASAKKHFQLAATEVARARKLLELEGARVADTARQNSKEVEQSQKAMHDLKTALEDTSIRPASADLAALPPPRPEGSVFYHCANCKVGGHGERFANYLLQRPNWRIYPTQVWFRDEKSGKEYFCPVGKNTVDFTDESKFSRISMYIRGHTWMEDKTKLFEVVPDCMPDTYVIDNLKWRHGRVPPDDDQVNGLPWFVKEADRNWGTSVHVCAKPSQCLSLAKEGALYAVQQHIADPLCMEDGRKCHIKFYILLICLADGVTWELHTYKDGYLSISPNRWSPDDLSKPTQVTIIRSERIRSWHHWEAVYPKCKAKTADVIRRLVMQDKLQGTPGRLQFEIMSADYIVDTHGDVWLFEFNTSPVLKDPETSPDVHDGDLITGALSIVIPWEKGHPGYWDLALRCEAPQNEQLIDGT